MITDSDPPRHPHRTLRVALALSLLVHGVGAVVYGALPLPAALELPVARPTPEEIVTISDALRIDRTPVVPPPQHRAAPHAPPRPHPPLAQTVAAAAVPRVVPPAVAPPPAAAPPTPPPLLRRQVHELSREVPGAPPQAPRPVRAFSTPALEPTPLRTAAAATPLPAPVAPKPPPQPTLAPATAPPQTVALAPRPVPPSRRAPAVPPSRRHLTPEQIAKIDRDLAVSIAQQRREENPLRVRAAPPAATRRYHMSVDSIHVGSLRRGEGTYWPISAGRRGSDGYTYYRCEYAYQWADGPFEQGAVPWLVRFLPSEDPMLHPELTENGPIGLPPPPPDFVLTPETRVGRALRGYFPNVAFTDD